MDTFADLVADACVNIQEINVTNVAETVYDRVIGGDDRDFGSIEELSEALTQKVNQITLADTYLTQGDVRSKLSLRRAVSPDWLALMRKVERALGLNQGDLTNDAKTAMNTKVEKSGSTKLVRKKYGVRKRPVPEPEVKEEEQVEANPEPPKGTIEHIQWSTNQCLVDPEWNEEDLTTLCQEAIEFRIEKITLPSMWVEKANDLFSRSDVEICCAIGFPNGQGCTSAKVAAARFVTQFPRVTMIRLNMPFAKVIGKDWDYIQNEASSVMRASNNVEVRFLFPGAENHEVLKESFNEAILALANRSDTSSHVEF